MENKIETAIRRDESLIDCEHAIIATLLNKPRLIGQAMASLDPEDFTGLRKPIFDAICRLYSTGKAVDTVVLTAQLGEEYRDYVYDIAKFPGNHAALEVYCESLRDGHRLEEAKEAATSVLYARSIAEASETIEKMAGLMSGRKRMRRLSAFDAASDFLDRLSDKRKKEFIQWGIDGLDINTYTELGDFVALGGYPSAGKTALACQIALEQAKRYRVGFFSLETKEDKLVDRMMAQLSGVELRKIKLREDLSQTEERALVRAAEVLSTRLIDNYHSPGATVQDIKAEALANRLQIVYIDYLQLLHHKGSTRYDKVTDISQELHTMAQDHGIMVVALSQLSRPEKKGDKFVPPGMQSFKESGQIEQDVDVGLILYNKEPNNYRSNRILKIAKNKEGVRANLELEFEGGIMRFTEATPESPPKPRRKRKAPAEEEYENEKLPI